MVLNRILCGAKKWSCEVVGSNHGSGANGPWNLFLLDFRHWTWRPSRRWCLLSSCYCTGAHKCRVFISEAFRKEIGSLPQPICSRSIPKAIQLCCVRRALLFWLLFWHSKASNVLLKFDASHHPVIVLLALEATCLSNLTVTPVEVVKARCQNCTSKLCLFFGHPSRLRNTCNPADVLQAVPWTALVREESCLQDMTLRDIWVEFEFRSVHHTAIPLQFV